MRNRKSNRFEPVLPVIYILRLPAGAEITPGLRTASKSNFLVALYSIILLANELRVEWESNTRRGRRLIRYCQVQALGFGVKGLATWVDSASLLLGTPKFHFVAHHGISNRINSSPDRP